MQSLGKTLRLYCFASGALLAGAVLALGLAVGLDLVEPQRLGEAIATLSGAHEAQAGGEDQGTAVAAIVPAAAGEPGMRLWEQRLRSMESSIESDVSGLGAEQDRLQRREKSVDDVSAALATYLTATFDEKITAEQVETRSDELVERIRERQERESRLPRLIETLGTMEPKALAAILAGSAQEPGLAEDRAVQLLSGLPARKAGAILNEMGKLDPNRAGRLIALLGEPDAPRIPGQ